MTWRFRATSRLWVTPFACAYIRPAARSAASAAGSAPARSGADTDGAGSSTAACNERRTATPAARMPSSAPAHHHFRGAGRGASTRSRVPAAAFGATRFNCSWTRGGSVSTPPATSSASRRRTACSRGEAVSFPVSSPATALCSAACTPGVAHSLPRAKCAVRFSEKRWTCSVSVVDPAVRMVPPWCDGAHSLRRAAPQQ
jgi:hypothetical protein